MACMEHECPKCGWWVSNNQRHMNCPKCGERCISTCDETPEDREPDDFEEYNRNEAGDYDNE